MSAFLVSHTHIAALVKFASENRTYASFLDAGTFDDMERLAERLAAECVASVSYRYPKDEPNELPGPIDRSIAVWPSFANTIWSTVPTLTPIAALKALSCYEYQSCEHPTWEQSYAHGWCQKLRQEAIGRLPGYEAAAWEINAA